MVDFQNLIDYFINPYETGYTVSKTLAYAIVFIVSAYLIYKLLKKLKIKIDKRLALAISPYIVFGGILRVLQDSGILTYNLFVTPGIWFFTSFILLGALVFSVFAERKKGIPYFKILFTLGLVLVSFSLPFIKLINFEGLLLISAFFLPWVIIFFLVRWTLENKAVSLVQLFDGTTTFIAMNFFGYQEQHVFPTFFIGFFSPVSFIFLKLIVVVAILILIDKFCKDKNFGRYLKLIIGILGGATATRDFIRLLALV